MTQKTILQLGAGPWMKHSITQIQQLGHRVYAIDRNPNAPAFALANGHAAIDLGDSAGIVAYAREIGADAILAANEAGILAAAEASQQLGLRHTPPQVALRAVDKGLMRQAWQAAGLSQPDFVLVDDVAHIAAAAEQIGYPCILKPRRNWGSRGVSKVNTPDELAQAIQFATDYRRVGAFIVEEYISGTELTVEGLAQGGTIHILAKGDKVHQVHDRYRVTMGLFYPARMPEPILQQTDALVAQAARALGLDDCAIHAEVMVHEEQVYLVEMAGRPGGGHIFGQIVGAVSGISMPQALAQILLGEDVHPGEISQRGVAYRFFTPPNGIFRGIEGLEEARQRAGVLDLGFQMEPGQVVDTLTSGAERPGFCVTTAPTRDEAAALAEEVISSLRYQMEPPQ